MGRSRSVPTSAEDDPSQTSKGKGAALSGEDVKSTNAGQETRKGTALFHCNYCYKDISGKVRIKCAKCTNFDLCVECFSVGAEITPHRTNHPYRVVHNLSFPLICPDWNADEEMLILEGLEMYGFGNWTDVAEHVGTKSKEQCIEHYNSAYLNSPCFPLPNTSHVVGKDRKEVPAMAKGNCEGKEEFPIPGELIMKEESTSPPQRLKIEESVVGGVPSGLIARTTKDYGVGGSSEVIAAADEVDKAPKMVQMKDGPHEIKREDSEANKTFRGKKPKSSGSKGLPMILLSGYNVKRREFRTEYNNDAEKKLADMEFNDTDTEEERKLKLRALHAYSKSLDDRKQRKDFFVEKDIIHYDPLEKDMSPEERKIRKQYNRFMRYHSKEDHEELIKIVIEEHQLQKRIQDLKEAREAGCRTSAEADIYLEQKRVKEAEDRALKAKESAQVGASDEGQQRGKHTSTAVQASASSLSDWDITGLPGFYLLSETEKRLCHEAKMLPVQYLKMQEVMAIEILKGNITNKSDARRFFKDDPNKVDGVFDVLVKKGITPP